MGDFFKDKKGYPRWSDSGKSVARTVVRTPSNRVVHHKDGNKSNFRKSNLQNMTRSTHSKLHAKKRQSSWL